MDGKLHISLQKGAIRDKKQATPISEQKLIFKGSESNPFLAPRGVCMTADKLIVADTGQNRVFVWNTIPTTTYQDADVILGQENVLSTGRNAGDKLSAASLMYPSGVWTDGTKLIVCDAWNHRVLIWHTMPTENGQPADVVLGQPDFTSNEPNVHGIGHAPTAQTLNWPYGCTVHEGRLFIADTGNRRVLVFDNIPTESYAAADHLIGKASFDERDYDNKDAIWPYAVKLSSDGRLVITDTQYYRVLYWDNWKDALTQKAKSIFGQPDFDSNGQNQYQLFPNERTINWTYDACFHKEGLFVADTGNSRVLHFGTILKENNPPATGVIGKSDFNTGSENADTIMGTESTMYWPFSISIQNTLVAIADTGNHRIIFHKLIDNH